MAILRSERFAALLLLAAAGLALALANSPLGPPIAAGLGADLSIEPLGVDLTAGGWVKDGLLAIFFFLAAIELRHELTRGELSSADRAFVPAIAAVGGVVVPAVIFLALVRDPALEQGWPVPTATDVAFALGVLALAGRGLPARIRALLLALAIIDDLVAIIIIAVFFTSGLEPLPLLAAVPVILLFGWLSHLPRSRRARPARLAALVALALAAWLLVYLSGIHPTIAGVALGAAMAPPAAGRARKALEPVSNAVVLPVFAFVAAFVVVPAVRITELSPVFWAILVALPLGKLVGITAGGMIASTLARRRSDRIRMPDLLVVAGLGGIGFTVSLLMNDLAYTDSPVVAVEGTLAVLAASVVSAVLGGVIALARAAHYRREITPKPEP